ncbi:MAG: hypothetical protein Q8P67_25425, partial [archaeon]|nr:hypothetical protein [archaeon]
MATGCNSCGASGLGEDEISGDVVCRACGLVQGRLVLQIEESSLSRPDRGVAADRLGAGFSTLEEAFFAYE